MTKHLPWWAKLGLIAFSVLSLYFLSASFGQFLFLVILGTVIVFACWRDYRLTLIVTVVLVWAIGLSGTRLGPGMHQISGGAGQLVDVGAGAVGEGIGQSLNQAPNVQVGVQPPTTVAPPTTAPAPAAVPAEAPAQAPAQAAQP